MLHARVIPCLLMQGDGLVKTIQFKNPDLCGRPDQCRAHLQQDRGGRAGLPGHHGLPEEGHLRAAGQRQAPGRPDREAVGRVLHAPGLRRRHQGRRGGPGPAGHRRREGRDQHLRGRGPVLHKKGVRRVRQPEHRGLHRRATTRGRTVRSLHPRRGEAGGHRPGGPREAHGIHGRRRDLRQLHRPGRHHAGLRPDAGPVRRGRRRHPGHRLRWRRQPGPLHRGRPRRRIRRRRRELLRVPRAAAGGADQLPDEVRDRARAVAAAEAAMAQGK